MKKIIFSLSVLIVLLFVVSCAPQGELTEEEVLDNLDLLSDDELDAALEEDNALAGQAYNKLSSDRVQYVKTARKESKGLSWLKCADKDDGIELTFGTRGGNENTLEVNNKCAGINFFEYSCEGEKYGKKTQSCDNGCERNACIAQAEDGKITVKGKKDAKVEKKEKVEQKDDFVAKEKEADEKEDEETVVDLDGDGNSELEFLYKKAYLTSVEVTEDTLDFTVKKADEGLTWGRLEGQGHKFIAIDVKSADSIKLRYLPKTELRFTVTDEDELERVTMDDKLGKEEAKIGKLPTESETTTFGVKAEDDKEFIVAYLEDDMKRVITTSDCQNSTFTTCQVENKGYIFRLGSGKLYLDSKTFTLDQSKNVDGKSVLRDDGTSVKDAEKKE